MSTPLDQSTRDRDELFARAQAGDQDAWKELFETCYPKVVRAVRGHLQRVNGRMMRSIYDSTDIASDVWKSLAAKSDRYEFHSVDELMGFLTHAAQQRVIDEYRRMTAAKRGENRKLPLYQKDGRTYDAKAGDPTPSEVAQARELEDQLEGGPSDSLRVLIRLKKNGESNEGAAEELGWDLRKVQRKLKSLYDSRRQHLGLGR